MASEKFGEPYFFELFGTFANKKKQLINIMKNKLI